MIMERASSLEEAFVRSTWCEDKKASIDVRIRHRGAPMLEKIISNHIDMAGDST